MEVAKLASRLRIDNQGIWTSSEVATLSYPKDGNEACFQVEDGSFWFRHRNNCIIASLKRFPPGGAILDVGGGNGFVTRRILDEGFEAVLLEPGRPGAMHAKTRRGVPEVICSTVEDAGFPPESLSAIGCFDVIEHIADDRDFVKHAYSLTKTGGLLYATLPAHEWLWSLSDVTAQHHRRYDYETVLKLLGEEYRVLFFSYVFEALTLPVLLLRALPYRLGLSRKNNLLSNEVEHGTGGGMMVGVFETLLAKEAHRIARGLTMHTGTSCLFVAEKC